MHTPIKNSIWIAVIVLLTAPAMSFAHHGTGVGLTAGLLHPLSGLDHLLALLATGLWAAQCGGRATWAIPLSFTATMVLGGGLGVLGIGLPLVETGIAASVLLIGILIATAVRLPLGAGLAILGIFAVCHGHAHGTEMPATASSIRYFVGFLAASALVQLAALVLGRKWQVAGNSLIIRWAGASIAVFGSLLLVQ